ncbi:putative mitochondrial AAA [Rosellinia necatrix]|uniref:Putative mitochondrial AAA n=1 Tax=Rosellinia necatrix TaxID=77044 RepID=A0A1W2TPC1_ROSNE|nr:putative mitochondrial AAA [Rosellinia necatrix]
MTLTRAGEDDHGLSAYARAFARAQKRLGSLEPEHEFPETDAPVNGIPDQPNEDPFADSHPEHPPTGKPNNDNFLKPPQTNEARPHGANERIPKPFENHSEVKVRVVNENGEPIPPWRAGQDMTAPKSFDDIRRNSTSQNNLLNVKESIRLADDWSEAEVSFENNKSWRGPPSWLPKRRGNGDGGDSSDDDKPAKDPNDEAYDSDLVTEASGEVRVVRVHDKKMRKWRALASGRFENMLLECIVNIDHIPAEYKNIYVDREIIKELERVTRLSLERKKSFSCGVLKGNRVTGAILWGPPGTGKTLLAKGLAKQSGCNMLSISTAELWQKCHGEDEKVIKALFSLGRKLHPCIIFLDEADAMLGARKAGEKRHIRSMLNQFLMEWDGLMSGLNSPFILLATNRPMDLDPAVLRRAPVHIHLDVPSSWERQQILKLLLADEKLQPGLTAAGIASQTHKYTGSDLKNMCVTAATHCVDEQAEAGLEDTTERTLTWEHFRRAMKTVRPTNLSGTMRNEFQKFQNKRPAPENNGHTHHEEDEE